MSCALEFTIDGCKVTGVCDMYRPSVSMSQVCQSYSTKAKQLEAIINPACDALLKKARRLTWLTATAAYDVFSLCLVLQASCTRRQDFMPVLTPAVAAGRCKPRRWRTCDGSRRGTSASCLASTRCAHLCTAFPACVASSSPDRGPLEPVSLPFQLFC